MKSSRYWSLFAPTWEKDKPILYNQNALNPDLIWVCEGITDTLTALSVGLDAVGTIGTQKGTASLFRGCQVVNIIADSDEPGVVHAKDFGLDIWSNQKLGDVNIHFLPEEYKDLNVFITSGKTIADLQSDQVQRITAPAALISDLSAKANLFSISMDRVEEVLDTLIYPNLVRRGSFVQEYYISMLKDLLLVPKERSRKKLSPIPDETTSQANPEISEDYSLLFVDVPRRHLALDFFKDENGVPTAFYTSYFHYGKQNGRIRDYMTVPKTMVIKPSRKIELLSVKDMDILPHDKLFIPDQMITCWDKDGDYGVEQFIKNPKEVDGSKLYEEIMELFFKYFWMAEAIDFTILVTFIFFTYFHPIFGVTPYIYLLGSHGVGKTALMELMKCLCFNSINYGVFTLAHVVRMPAMNRGTSFFDEAHRWATSGGKLSADYEQIRDHVRTCYKEGSPTIRMDESAEKGKLRQGRLFEAWAPAILAARREPELNIADRCIIIHQQPAPARILSLLPNLTANKKFVWNNQAQEIRNKLHTFAFQNFQYTIELCNLNLQKHIPKEIVGREYEKWYPLLLVGEILDRCKCSRENLRKILNPEFDKEDVFKGDICRILLESQIRKSKSALFRIEQEDIKLLILSRTLEATKEAETLEPSLFESGWVEKKIIKDKVNGDDNDLSSKYIFEILRSEEGIMLQEKQIWVSARNKGIRVIKLDINVLKERINSYLRTEGKEEDRSEAKEGESNVPF